jgi:methionyl-tRNA formyltransferase
VVAAFGQILKKEVLDLPRHGCLNLHASLLPRWRGAAPVHAAILAGDELTGVCIMVMEEGLDTGPVLAMQSLRIGPQDTTGCVSEKLSRLGADLLMEALPGYLSGEIVPRPQPAAGVTYAPMLNKEDGLLDFSRPAEELERRVRAMDPWPGAWFEWRGKPLKVSRSSILPHGKQGIGSKFIAGGNPAITTARGALILEELQPAGRRKMSGKAFLAGVKDWDAAQPPDRPAG